MGQFMKTMKNTLITLLASLATFPAAWGVELPDILGDNAVLQQQTQARLWGWAKAGNYVQVTTGWDHRQYVAQAGNDGRWTLQVTTPKAGFNAHSIVYDEYDARPQADTSAVPVDTKTVDNVLIGEVWFCSGQSNMEMPLGGFWNCPVEGGNEAIAYAGRYAQSVRVATIEKTPAQEPQTRVRGGWDVASPANAPRFSAVAWFFATTLTDILQVPVGVINCSWGGSCVEGWMPKEVLLTYPDGLTPIDDTDYHAKMVMYNGMLAPLEGYTVKGFLWNQGESNVGREEEYVERFQTMAQLWRKLWNQPADALPFYTVELPPYRYGDADGTSAADFRAAQHRIARLLPHSGCVCTSDLIYPYELDQIHGAQKQPIGQRMAYMALTRDYGIQGIAAEAPELERWTLVDASPDDIAVIAGSRVETPRTNGCIARLYFTNSIEGFDRMTDIPGFEAQDSQGVWHKAIVWSSSEWQNVERLGCFLSLACPEADRICNVRYCYRNFAIGTLHTVRGLPLVPFTTEKGAS